MEYSFGLIKLLYAQQHHCRLNSSDNLNSVETAHTYIYTRCCSFLAYSAVRPVAISQGVLYIIYITSTSRGIRRRRRHSRTTIKSEKLNFDNCPPGNFHNSSLCSRGISSKLLTTRENFVYSSKTRKRYIYPLLWPPREESFDLRIYTIAIDIFNNPFVSLI